MATHPRELGPLRRVHRGEHTAAIDDRDTRVRDDAEWLAAAAAYGEAKHAADMMATALDEAKSGLAGFTSHAKEHGGGVSVTRLWKKGAVQYQRIPGIAELELEQYRGAPREEARITTS